MCVCVCVCSLAQSCVCELTTYRKSGKSHAPHIYRLPQELAAGSLLDVWHHFEAPAASYPCGCTCRPIIQTSMMMHWVPMHHSLLTFPVACRQLAAAGSSSRRAAGPDLLPRQARHLSRHRFRGGCAPPGEYGHHRAPALAQCCCWRPMQPGPCQSTQSGVLAAHMLPLICNLLGRTRRDTIVPGLSLSPVTAISPFAISAFGALACVCGPVSPY